MKCFALVLVAFVAAPGLAQTGTVDLKTKVDGKSVEQWLVVLEGSKDKDEIETASKKIASLGGPIAKVLAKDLADEKTTAARAGAIRSVFFALGTKGKDAQKELATAFATEDRVRRIMVASCIFKLGDPGLDSFIALLKHDSAPARYDAAFALSWYALNDDYPNRNELRARVKKDGVPALVKALRVEKNNETKISMLASFSALGELARDAIPALAFMQTDIDEPPGIRLLAENALNDIGKAIREKKDKNK